MEGVHVIILLKVNFKQLLNKLRNLVLFIIYLTECVDLSREQNTKFTMRQSIGDIISKIIKLWEVTLNKSDKKATRHKAT